MNTMKHYALLGLSVLLASCGGGGGPAPAPPPTNPSSSNPPALNIVKIGEGGRFLRTAANAQGDVIAVWRKFSDDPIQVTQSEIWANVYHPVTGWGTAQKVQSLAIPYNVEVAMDNHGDAVVAWQENLVNPIAAVLKTAAYVAGVWQSPQVLDQDAACAYPNADPSGVTVVYMTWCVADEVRSSSYRRGSGWSVPTRVPLALPGEAGPNPWQVKSSIDSSGVVQVIASTPYDLRTVRGVAGAWGPVSVVQSFSTLAGRNPYLAVGVNGHAVTAWVEPMATGSQVWVAYYDGAIWQPPVLLEDSRVVYLGEIQVKVGSDGAAVLVWGSTHAGRYRGGVWDTAVLAVSATPHLAMNANGDVRAVWAAGAGEVWSRHFSGAQPWSAPVQLTDPRTSNPLVELAPDGKPMLIWADENGVWSMAAP